MNRTSICRWLKAADGRGKGERALASRPATGRTTKLTPTQRAQVFRWINGCTHSPINAMIEERMTTLFVVMTYEIVIDCGVG